MLRARVIPCLLLQGKGLVKTRQFQNPTYIGDPVNAVKIFNEKEADELIFLDIKATRENRGPDLKIINSLADECFMPLAVGGGIKTLKNIRDLFSLGVEKVVINTEAYEKPSFVRQAAQMFGSQSIVVSIDVRDKRVYTHNGVKQVALSPAEAARQAEQMGAGEIMITSIDRDGMMAGYDLGLIKSIIKAVTIPVVACGGAGKVKDLYNAICKGGASAAAAGSLFVFYGARRAVLVNYPSSSELKSIRQISI